MEKTTNILKSFKTQDTLNPKIWNITDNTLNSKIRESLLNVANEFIDNIDFNIFYDDVVITGSLCNYNWSKYSDIDLHIIVDYSQFPKELHELFKEFFNLKKIIFNENHTIKIKGFDVEVYIQDSKEEHISKGVYSILFDNWLNKPEKENIKINKKFITNKANKWMELIDNIINLASSEDLENSKKIINYYKEKLKKYRQSGLDKYGEFSDENLVFKILRRNGYIEKLFDFAKKIVDKKLSVDENLNIIE
jgi:hypothetical protein